VRLPLRGEFVLTQLWRPAQLAPTHEFAPTRVKKTRLWKLSPKFPKSDTFAEMTKISRLSLNNKKNILFVKKSLNVCKHFSCFLLLFSGELFVSSGD
jgi:hypothetical protein